RPDWYWRVLHRAERERGLDDEEDLFTPGTVEIALDDQREVVVVIGTEPTPPGWDVATSSQAARQRQAALRDPATDHPLAPALAAYLRVSRDWRFVADRLDALEGVIDWHVRGTRHNIRMDAGDGLLAGGEEGYALTWMDARVEDWAVSPRAGKPVEINALWYNALCLTADWCERAMRPAGQYREMALRVRESAQARFWYGVGGYCFDVVDGPDGDDPSLRPNQVIALALVYPLIEGDRARCVLDVVTAKLLIPYGL